MSSRVALFAGHDPGSVNHVRPLMAKAEAEGLRTALMILRPPPESGKVASASSATCFSSVRDACPGRAV
eukprot:scaffold41032_cov33-Prasinocladus_malaysianus.AAC.1